MSRNFSSLKYEKLSGQDRKTDRVGDNEKQTKINGICWNSGCNERY